MSANFVDEHSLADHVALILGRLRLLALRLEATKGLPEHVELHARTKAEKEGREARLDAIGAEHAAARFPRLVAADLSDATADDLAWPDFFERNRGRADPAELAAWSEGGGRARLLEALRDDPTALGRRLDPK